MTMTRICKNHPSTKIYSNTWDKSELIEAMKTKIPIIVQETTSKIWAGNIWDICKMNNLKRRLTSINSISKNIKIPLRFLSRLLIKMNRIKKKMIKIQMNIMNINRFNNLEMSSNLKINQNFPKYRSEWRKN